MTIEGIIIKSWSILESKTQTFLASSNSAQSQLVRSVCFSSVQTTCVLYLRLWYSLSLTQSACCWPTDRAALWLLEFGLKLGSSASALSAFPPPPPPSPTHTCPPPTTPPS